MDKMPRLAATGTLAPVTWAWLSEPFSAVIEEMTGTYRILESPPRYARPPAR
jgi:hypothetical protein